MAPGIFEVTRNKSPWYSWMLRLAQTEHEDPFPDGRPAEIAAWRDRCRERLEGLIGRMPERVPLAVEIRDSEDCDRYVRESLIFDTEADMSVPAYLLIPHDRTAPGPAVLAVHGHGPGKDVVCGLATTEAPNQFGQ